MQDGAAKGWTKNPFFTKRIGAWPLFNLNFFRAQYTRFCLGRLRPLTFGNAPVKIAFEKPVAPNTSGRPFFVSKKGVSDGRISFFIIKKSLGPANLSPVKTTDGMKHEHYPFSSDEEGCFFEFESIGPKGVIQKVISIDHYKGDLWNLAFGDKTDDGWTDDVVSNNLDLMKVMATVVAAALEFSRRHPKRRICVHPLDERRKILYNAIFKRHYEEIGAVFDVFGQIRDSTFRYDPVFTFDEFYISRKPTNFVKK